MSATLQGTLALGSRVYVNGDGIRWARQQIDQHQITHPALQRLLLAIGEMVDRDGICWPSMETLAALVDRCARQIYRDLRKLVAMGLLKIRHRTGRRGLNSSNEYTLQRWSHSSPDDQLRSPHRKNEKNDGKLRVSPSDSGPRSRTKTPESCTELVLPLRQTSKIEREQASHLASAVPPREARRAPRDGGVDQPPVEPSEAGRKIKPGLPTPQEMLEDWNAAVAGTPLPPAQMNGRYAGQLAHVAHHPVLEEPGPTARPVRSVWRAYCRWLAKDPFYRGETRRAGPIALALAATDAVLETAFAYSQAKRETRPVTAISGRNRQDDEPPRPSQDEGSIVWRQAQQDPGLMAVLETFVRESADSAPPPRDSRGRRQVY